MGSAADFGTWFVQSNNNLAVGPGIRDHLQHFGGNIARVEVRENKDIGLSSNNTIAGALVFSHGWVQG